MVTADVSDGALVKSGRERRDRSSSSIDYRRRSRSTSVERRHRVRRRSYSSSRSRSRHGRSHRRLVHTTNHDAHVAYRHSRHRYRSSLSRGSDRSRRHRSKSRHRHSSSSKYRDVRSRERSRHSRPQKAVDDPEERERREHEQRRQREIEAAQREDLTVLVINIHLSADERDIYEAFSEHAGKVRDVQCVRDARSGRSKGVAYVEFYTQESVIKALAMNGFDLKGQRIRVQSSQAEKNRAARAARLIQQQAVEVADSPFTIQVTGLTGSLSSISEVEIKQMFSPFGNIIEVEILRDPHSNLPLGQAYLKFKRASEAKEAVTAMNGFDIGGQTIKVAYATGANATGRLATHGDLEFERLDEDGGGLISGANNKIALMHKLQRTSDTVSSSTKQASQSTVCDSMTCIIVACLLRVFTPRAQRHPLSREGVPVHLPFCDLPWL